MHLIKNDNAVRNIVKLSQPAAFSVVKALEELNIGGDDKGCVPVLAHLFQLVLGYVAAFIFIGTIV